MKRIFLLGVLIVFLGFISSNANALQIIYYPSDQFTIIESPDFLDQKEIFATEGINIYVLPLAADTFFIGTRTAPEDGDRYQNVDTSYLLANIEYFSGITPLASNLLVLPENDSELFALTSLYNELAENLTTPTADHGVKSLWLVAKERVAPIPEPTTMILFATGLVGLAGSRLRRKKK